MNKADGEKHIPRITLESMPVGIGSPGTRALEDVGVASLGQLAGYSAKALSALHGFGPKSLRLIREQLAAFGKELSD